VRRAAFAASIAVAPAPVTAFITALVAASLAPSIVALARLASIAILVAVFLAALAVEALARPAVSLPARFRRRCRIRGTRWRAIRRLIGASFTKITMTVTPSMPMALAPGAFALFAARRHGCAGSRALVAAMSSTIVTLWTPLVRASAGTPDLDQFWFGRRRGSG